MKFEGSNPNQREDYRHIPEEPKIDQMGNLKTEVEFLERRMQRVRTKLQKPQQVPTQPPSMSIGGLRPKQCIDHHDYHIMEQGKAPDNTL